MLNNDFKGTPFIFNTLLIRLDHYFWSEFGTDFSRHKKSVPDTENLWRTHVVRRNLRRTCVLRRKSVEDMCPHRFW